VEWSCICHKDDAIDVKADSQQRGWEYLLQMNFRQGVPRAQHDDGDILAAASMEKN
jgi:hypothetical protein